MFGGKPLYQSCHFLFEESETWQDHVLAWDAPVSQAVYSTDKVDILGCGRVYSRSRVDAEGARLCPVHTVNVKLEHRSELWPEGHAHTIVIEVQYWNPVPLLHQLLELIIELNAKEDGVDVDATTRAGSCRSRRRCSLLNRLLQAFLGRWGAVVLREPLQVLIDYSWEYLVEDRRYLHKFKVEEFKDKDELFAHGIDDQLVLRSKDLFKVELASLWLRDSDDDGLTVDALKDGGPILDIDLHLLACRCIKHSLIELKRVCRVQGPLRCGWVCSLHTLSPTLTEEQISAFRYFLN